MINKLFSNFRKPNKKRVAFVAFWGVASLICNFNFYLFFIVVQILTYFLWGDSRD